MKDKDQSIPISQPTEPIPLPRDNLFLTNFHGGDDEDDRDADYDG